MAEDGESSIAVRHLDNHPMASLTAKLEDLARLGDSTRANIQVIRESGLPPAQIIRVPGGALNDFYARVSGLGQQRAFVYSNGRLVETDIKGGDVTETYDLQLKQLKLDGDFEYDRMSRELEEKQSLAEALVFQDGKEQELQGVRTRIEELTQLKGQMRPKLRHERERLQAAIMNIPIGAVLFLAIQNAENLYPVVVVEDDNGIKWIELLSEAPNGTVNGGIHPVGFRTPLRNHIEAGTLYLPVGTRSIDRTIEENALPMLQNEAGNE